MKIICGFKNRLHKLVGHYGSAPLLLLGLLLGNVAASADMLEAIRTFQGHTDTVESVVLSPDGRTALSGSWDHALKMWNVETGQEIRTLKGHTDYIMSVAFSSDGRYALSGSGDNTIKVWDIQTGQEIRTLEGDKVGHIYSIAFSPDGDYALLSGSHDNKLKLWRIETGAEIRTFEGHEDWVFSISFSADGRYALSGGYDDTMKLWDVETGQEIHSFDVGTDVLSVTFSADGGYALSVGTDKIIKVWDIETKQKIGDFQWDTAWVNSVVFSTGGGHILPISDETLKVSISQTGQEVGTLQAQTGAVLSAAFYKGRYLLSGHSDNTIKLWHFSLLTMAGLQRAYNVGESVVVDLAVQDNILKPVDLWVAIQVPTGELFFRTPLPEQPFSLDPQPFKTAVEGLGMSHRLLALEIPPGIGGNYALYTLYVDEGKNPLVEGSEVWWSNLAVENIELANE